MQNPIYQHDCAKKNAQLVKHSLSNWFKTLSKWLEEEIKILKEWNSKVRQSNLQSPDNFLITIPKSYDPNLKEFLEIYQSSLSKEQRVKIMGILLSHIEEMAKVIHRQLTFYRMICYSFFEIINDPVRESKFFDFTALKQKLQELINGIGELSFLSQTLESIPTPQMVHAISSSNTLQSFRAIAVSAANAQTPLIP